MDRDRHIAQDAAEHYAVYLMAETAETLGVAQNRTSHQIWDGFVSYLTERNWTFEEEFTKLEPDYKVNVDSQVPRFVQRLASLHPDSKFDFSIDEANFRNQGLKADFVLAMDDFSVQHFVSLKNYTGSSGIVRPQVSSGTFLSFAASFAFDRAGVGTYRDPRSQGQIFKGSDTKTRTDVLLHEGREELISQFAVLESLQATARDSLLSLRFYDRDKVRDVIREIVPQAQQAITSIFEIVGIERVREKFLERIGLDGSEDIFFFDKSRFVDSLTNPKFHDLCQALNSDRAAFEIETRGQGLAFSFKRDGRLLLQADVPLTINTNGAWHRPKERYKGKQAKLDKGHLVHLEWGELRPHKSKELATSTNSYLNLGATGIFD